MELDLTDLTPISTEELEDVYAAVQAEIDRRLSVKSIEQEAERLVARFEAVTGRKDGDVWRQPHGAHDAYRKKAEVTFQGKRWRSLLTNNVLVPGEAGWEEVLPPEAGPAEWRQPIGGDGTYTIGSRVVFEGKIWESIFPGINVWSPSAYPQGWKLIGPAQASGKRPGV